MKLPDIAASKNKMGDLFFLSKRHIKILEIVDPLTKTKSLILEKILHGERNKILNCF